eukprot:jgi/Psemu1/300077/fgenesh1_kg.6_\
MIAACSVSPVVAHGLSINNEQTEDVDSAIVEKLQEDLVFDVPVERSGSLRGSSSSNVERALGGCSENKKVTLYKFCIKGDCDSGAYGEHRLRLDGHWLWNGYRDFREGQCHNIQESPRIVNGWGSLTVGTEEHDSTSENDSWFATMSSNEWYMNTCETYEVELAEIHSVAVHHSSCIEVSASYKGVLNAGVKHCSEWTQPAEAFIWYLKVEPAGPQDSPIGWHDSDGIAYDCGWYSEGNRCSLYGNDYRNFGKTASEACVVCGGGL